MKLHILKVEQSCLDMFVSTVECPSPPHEALQTGMVVLSCYPCWLHRKMECSVGCLENPVSTAPLKQTPQQDVIAKLHLLVCL